MNLSRDYTYVRIATLSDPLIEEFLTTRYPGITNEQYEPLTVEDVKKIESDLATAIPGNEGLATEWVLKALHSYSTGKSDLYSSVDELVDDAIWYFNKKKDPNLRKVVEHYSKVSRRKINTSNILSFSAADLSKARFDYYILQEKAKINLFPAELPEGSRLFYDSGAYKIVEVTDVTAACKLARDTEWCTAHEGAAESYLDRAPLYVIYRNQRKIAQMHLGMGADQWTGTQLMNLKDDPMKVNEEMRQVLIDSGLMQRLLENMAAAGGFEPGFIRFVGTQDNPEIRAICSKDPVLATLYVKTVLHGRFPEAEPIIVEHGNLADYLIQLNRVGGQLVGEFLEDYPDLKKYFGEIYKA